MPTTGVHPPPSLLPKSHTSTQQWQSFEIRMRRRRAQRCRLRAQVALEAGVLDEANSALEEARRLEPHSPELATLEQALADAQVAPAAAAVGWGARGSVAAAAAAVVAVSTWILSGDSTPAAPPLPAHAVVAADERVGTTNSLPAPNVEASKAAADPIRIREEQTTPAEIVQETVRPPRREPEPQPAPVARVPARATHIDVDPLTAHHLTVPVSSPPTRPIVTIAEPPPSAAVAAVDAAREPESPPPPTVNEAARVRSVLSRYAAAYNALDAHAARDVWPGVNARALSRAFESLQSQHVSLGNCAVMVNGLSAHATCSGSATWVPKIGGGTRTEDRRWTFDLQQAGDQWQIVQATVR